jgi:hypothetical protein
LIIMNIMKFGSTLMLCGLLILVVGCQEATTVCPTVTGTPEYLTTSPDHLPTPTHVAGQFQVEIGRREMLVDKVVKGPLCNDTWSGTVYVTCDVQVYPWTEDPLFLKTCQLDIEPQAVVYVAYHNNTAYYNGCSCHTGITPEP